MDSKLLALVEKHGPRNWTVIGAIMSLTGKQCRERILNGLAPHKKGPWTQEEDGLLFDLQDVFGNRWAHIARCLDGRTENNVKNRWHSLKRKAERTGQRFYWTAPCEQTPSPRRLPARTLREGKSEKVEIEQSLSSPAKRTTATQRDSSLMRTKRTRIAESLSGDSILFDPYIPYAPDIMASFLSALPEGLVSSSGR
jgi:hypothetical protein